MARDRDAEPEERPGQLSYRAADGAEVVLPVQLRPRGNSRRDREVCTFPPLRVNLKKSTVRETLFAKQNNLKLVTHCRSPEKFQNYLLLEYLAYRIYNTLTPASFRVRLLEISWQDTESSKAPLTRLGFFIEHKDRLAKRLDTEVVEVAGRISVDSLDRAQTTLAEVFQFMVSNTDFSFIAPPEGDACCHNAVLLMAPGGGYLPVPYDFDRTGLVSPPNGQPDLALKQRNFRDRLYRGFCRDDDYFEQALARTRDKRGEIEALISDQQGLADRFRSQALKFIDDYYQIINDEQRRSRMLKCRSVS